MLMLYLILAIPHKVISKSNNISQCYTIIEYKPHLTMLYCTMLYIDQGRPHIVIFSSNNVSQCYITTTTTTTTATPPIMMYTAEEQEENAHLLIQS